MKKNLLILILLSVMPILTWGQTYQALWKKVSEAERKDLPQTAYNAVQEIVEKATKEKAYGQLLKAELKGAQVKASISPDSLQPAVEALAKRAAQIDDEVLKTVYQTVLWKVNETKEDPEGLYQKPKLTEALCEKLAQVKDDAYEPFVITGSDSKLFDHDLLSIIGYELNDYEPLHHYYEKVGNRPAACLTALEDVRNQVNGERRMEVLDSLIKVYENLPEAGALAMARYDYMESSGKFTTEEKITYLRQTISKWPDWQQMNSLRNAERGLTNPQFTAQIPYRIALPQREQTVELKELRNLQKVKRTIYRVNANGDIDLNPNTDEHWKKLKKLITPIETKEVTFSGKKDYELFEDSMTLQGLPIGVYLLEFSSEPKTDIERRLYQVTDLYVMSEEQPNDRIRYVVVSATTGQPVGKAHLRIKEYTSWKDYTTHNLTTNSKGECYYEKKNNRRIEVWPTTDADKAAPETNLGNRYSYYEGAPLTIQTVLYTDRSIYRPGQTVHAAAIVYEVRNGYKHQVVKDRQVTFELRDANYKEVKRVTVQTDEFGSCSVDLTLPSSGLTGRYSLRASDATNYIRVEEYKRPTFQVEFSEMKENYKAGDTVKVTGTARSYAGVPVQGAKVKYKVVRRLAFWWWSYCRYWSTEIIGNTTSDTDICSGEVTTGDDGTFTVEMPMALPESSRPLFYNFVVTADVTDVGGETHTGQYSLPIGNRKTALSIDVADKILAESKPTITFHLRNAAGNDIDAEVKYQLDGGQWLTTKTNSRLSLPKDQLKSGKHHVKVMYGGETEERDFVVFSKDDKRPATATDDWFWVSDSQFPNDGTPVTVQVGSSAKDVHIVYSIFSGETLIEEGSVDRSNELLNRKLTYKPEWDNGILLTFAWVKENVCYTHTTTIRRPLPDKQLKLSWNTFRDRLTPGQQEEWTLTILGPDGKPANAQMMVTLYDKSLDQLSAHYWYLSPYTHLPLPSVTWNAATRSRLSTSASQEWDGQSVRSFYYRHFDHDVYPSAYHIRIQGFGRSNHYTRAAGRAKFAVDAAPMVMESAAMMDEVAEEKAVLKEVVPKAKETVEEPETEEQGTEQVQMRENLNETAFFYPQLLTDAEGVVSLKFTLPESLTTWRFMGIAHTQDMCYGSLGGEAVAKKDVMIQPNVPRFVREGDKATISARIFNTSEKTIKGKARLRLLNPETEAVIFETTKDFDLKEGGTGSVSFDLASLSSDLSPLICQVSAYGDGFSDGEQHYLPVLPSSERVTVTMPFTQIEPGKKTIDLTALVPADSKNPKVTFEYTNNPAWLMIQALPTVGKPYDDDAISQAASFYANSIGRHVLAQNPQAKTAFRLWQQEGLRVGDGTSGMTGNETSLMSSLEKNQELKDLMLSETPWVLDAENEAEQKQRLADFFDENLMSQRLESAITKLQKLQGSDGAWSWWPQMPGSFYMTVAISEMLVRLNAIAGTQNETAKMLKGAFRFMGKEIVEEVEFMKKMEKKGHKPTFPSFKALQWLYLSTLDGRELPSNVEEANKYLLNLMKKDIKSQTMYEKAMTAIILYRSPLLQESDRRRAREYVQSLKEYTVYREDMGRYYDTPRAGYSWYDYKIPTQTMAIEALQRITPDDQQTILEMQRWLLQSKRTQAWDTPINSVNAVYAFLNGGTLELTAQKPAFTVDAQPLETPKATAAIGYVKTVLPDTKAKTLTVEKTSEGTSWGAVYAQFTQQTKNIKDSGAGLIVKREVLTMVNGQWSMVNGQCHVGDRVKIRITIEADRDYDFVQVIDRRAACMEPVRQLSGYHDGSYCTPRDNTTNYFFDRFSKGHHEIETEYYIDRPGTYETGSCTVMCAYSPEFRGTTKSQTIIVK